MPLIAFLAILISAVLHPLWNTLLKRSSAPLSCLWGAMLGSSILLAPIVLIVWVPSSLKLTTLGILIASSLLTAAYFRLLTATYERDDLSRVYPFTRGLPPVLLLVVEAIGLGHRPSVWGVLGVALIAFGVYALHLRSLRRQELTVPLRALRDPVARLVGLNAVAIAGYGFMNKLALNAGVPPLAVFAITNLLAALMLWGWRPRQLSLAPASAEGREALRWGAVGALQVVTYGLVLWAMNRAPVSYVEAVRQMGIVFGTLAGVYWLNEPFGQYKLIGSTLVFAGIVLILVIG